MSETTPSAEPPRKTRTSWLLWLRWSALLMLVGIGGIMLGSHVQSKVDRGEKLSPVDKVVSEIISSPRNIQTIVDNPAVLKNPSLPDRPEIEIPAGKVYFVGEDTIPIDKDYLYCRYDDQQDTLEVVRRNLKTNKIVKQWSLPYELLDSYYQSWYEENHPDYSMYERLWDHLSKEPAHFVLLPLEDGRLVITPPALCFDGDGKVAWHARVMTHHSAELDHAGNIWICSLDRRQQDYDEYHHDQIVKLDAQTGEVLYRKNIREMFLDNPKFDMSHQNNNDIDPYHLNDIQPVLTDGPHWQRGDLFISLRNISTVLLYRPATGKILWRNSTSWANQHDVNILDDHTITVFDNNIRRTLNEEPVFKLGKLNRCIAYDLKTQAPRHLFADLYEQAQIATPWQGRVEWLQDDQLLYVESTEQCFFVVFDLKANKSYKFVIRGHRPGYVANLRWFRLLDSAHQAGGS